MSFSGRGIEGTGAAVEEEVGVSEETTLRSARDEKIAAVAAAPVAAEIPAMMARVVLDIVPNYLIIQVIEEEEAADLKSLKSPHYIHNERSHQALERARDSRCRGSDVPGCMS